MSGTPLKDASARCPRGWRRTEAWPRRCSWGDVADVAQILRVPTPGRLHVSAARLPRLCAPPGWCGTVGRLAGAARSAPRAQALQATGQWGEGPQGAQSALLRGILHPLPAPGKGLWTAYGVSWGVAP